MPTSFFPAKIARLRAASCEYPGCGQVLLASYPRSGNSLLRRLIERVTGVHTGSDTRADRALGRQLKDFGLLGEGRVDPSVWVVKTHWPERKGHAIVRGERTILLVRNPFNALVSYFNMLLTQTHTSGIADTDFERLQEFCSSLFTSQSVPLLLIRSLKTEQSRP